MITRKFGPRLATLGAALLGLGCVHTEAYSVVFAPTNREGVAVYASRAPQSGRELGAVRVEGGIGIEDNDVRDLYKEAVRQTKALGGDALVIEAIITRIEREPRHYKADKVDPACNVGCGTGVAPKSVKETMTVELRGKALRLSPEGPDAEPLGLGP
ncbi:MAG TPA: hypothetical protein VFS43_44990 [Polyangiaceae bacterium]|nr:hypothetical protein [Polyangiaceae bacterium]